MKIQIDQPGSFRGGVLGSREHSEPSEMEKAEETHGPICTLCFLV